VKFTELVNIDELRGLCETFTAITGMVTAILDLDGNILLATGWQDICTQFHRVNPITAKRCRESDTLLAGQVKQGNKVNVYKCKNGLVDIAAPIKVRDVHVANFFTGQFFFEPPNKEFFIHQAEEFGFDKDAYMAALDRVPIFSSDTIQATMAFFSHLAQLFGEMGLARKELEEANKSIKLEAKHAGESEEKFKLLADTSPLAIYLSSELEQKAEYVNPTFTSLFGYTMDEVPSLEAWWLLAYPDEKYRKGVEKQWQYGVEQAIATHSTTEQMITVVTCKDGSKKYVSWGFSAVGKQNWAAGFDLTEIKQAEEALNLSNEVFEKLTSSAKDGIIQIDHQGKVVFWNQGATDIFGYPPDEIMGKNMHKLLAPPTSQEKHPKAFPEVLNSGQGEAVGTTVELEAMHKNGQKIIVELSLSAFEIKGHRQAMAVVRDVTERRQVLEIITREKQTAQTYLDIAGVMFGTLNVDGNITMMNKKGYQILGYPEGALLGRNWFELCIPSAVQKEITEVFRCQMTGALKPLEFYENAILNSTGEERIIAFHNTLLADENGLTGVLFSGEDITERKQLESRLKTSLNQLDSIFNVAPVGIGAVIDRNLKVVNKRLIEMLGYAEEELVGKNSRILYASDEEFERVGKEKYAQINEKGTGTVETVFRKKNGSLIDVLSSSTPLDLQDLSQGVTFTALDITQRNRDERELRKYRDHLEEQVAERTKALLKANKEYTEVNDELTEFAYIVSHDLKAPLRAISQLTHWIATDYTSAFDAEGKMQMDLILQRVKRMDTLIDGILHYSRIGRVREQEELLDLNLVVNEVIDDIAPNDDVHVSIDNNLPKLVSDATRIRQVFQNLIGNAVKFIDKSPGLVQVGCSEDDKFWTFTIRDNGPGIKLEYFDKIFKIFQTLSARDDYESTGIGLSLVKKIINRYGGSIWLESEIGCGTTFFFTLPKIGVTDEKH